MKKRIKQIAKTFLYVVVFLIVVLALFFYIPLSSSYLAEKIGNQAEYYFENKDQWMAEHNVFEIAYYKLWELKARKELLDNIHGRFEKQKELSVIRFSANEIRNKSIHQHQHTVPVITGSALTCLVRGFGYCDQVNSGLSLILQDKVEDASLYNVFTEDNGHTLVKSKSELGTVWVDAYGCVNVFGFADELTPQGKQEVGLDWRNEEFIFPEESYRKATFFNSFTFTYAIQKGCSKLGEILTGKNKKHGPDVIKVEPILKSDTVKVVDRSSLYDLIQEENIPAKRAYLMARICHLMEDNDKAVFYYKKVKEETPEGFLTAYADIFVKRIEGKEILCSKAKN